MDKQVTNQDVIEMLVQVYREQISPGLLTTGQAAMLLRVSEATIKRYTDDGRIRAIRTPGGHRKISAESLAAYLNTAEAREHRPRGPKPVRVDIDAPIPMRLTERGKTLVEVFDEADAQDRSAAASVELSTDSVVEVNQ